MTTLHKDTRTTAHQFNTRHGWDIRAAQALAIEVLTDANDHALVRYIKARDELILEATRLIHKIERDNIFPHPATQPLKDILEKI